MEERNVKISLGTAKEWYNGNNASLKQIALQAFSEEELTKDYWKKITSFERAYLYLKESRINNDLISAFDLLPKELKDTYIGKVLKYQIIVAALTNNEERHLTTGERWYPIVQFCKSEDIVNCQGDLHLGKIISEGKIYNVIGGASLLRYDDGGLGDFCGCLDVSNIFPEASFITVTSRKIAIHISRYFGNLLFDVLYGGTSCDWKWIK